MRTRVAVGWMRCLLALFLLLNLLLQLQSCGNIACRRNRGLALASDVDGSEIETHGTNPAGADGMNLGRERERAREEELQIRQDSFARSRESTRGFGYKYLPYGESCP